MSWGGELNFFIVCKSVFYFDYVNFYIFCVFSELYIRKLEDFWKVFVFILFNNLKNLGMW